MDKDFNSTTGIMCADGEAASIAHQKLESVLERISPENEHEWSVHVLEDLRDVREMIYKHVEDDYSPDGLMTEIHNTILAVNEHFNELRASHENLLKVCDVLYNEVERCAGGADIDIGRLRKHAHDLLDEMCTHRNLRCSLIIDAFSYELGGLD